MTTEPTSLASPADAQWSGGSVISGRSMVGMAATTAGAPAEAGKSAAPTIGSISSAADAAVAR